VALGLAVLLVQGCASVPHPGDSGLSLPGLASFPAEVALVSTHWSDSEAAGHGTEPQGRTTCGGLVVPPDWPDFSSGDGEALLAPFLTCASPAEFVALQQCVDMPRLLEALDDWRAVLLGALGPVREDAAHLLQRKRATFLVSATERYGTFHAEVFALFVLHSAHDDEVDAVLRLLARDKQLAQTLALMPAVREELRARGLPLSGYRERAEQAGDVLRGLGRAGRDALATSQLVQGPRYLEMTGRWTRLPPPYQRAAHEVEQALALRHFSAGNVALGAFDHLTFGVPLGFSYLVAGTGQGAYSLSRGHYEQATRELAPAVLLGALYVGGKGVRALSEARGATGVGTPSLNGLQAAEPRLRNLQQLVRQLEAKLGMEGLRELARDIRARREAGRFVAVGGVDAALALREARGDVARAQAHLSRARPEVTGASAPRSGTHKGAAAAESLASLVDEAAGLTREVVEARLALVELETPGPRLPRNMAVLEKQRPSVDAPPPGAEGNPRWGEYVAYYEKRLGELQQGKAAETPLRWAPYEQMWGGFARGLAFERLMVALLEADAALPRTQRRFLGAFHTPRILRSVGVKKPESGLRYADVLVLETGGPTAGPPRVETFSFKSRNLAPLKKESLMTQMVEDAREAQRKYGGTLDIRRDSLQPLLREGSEVPVQRVRLVYEGGSLKPAKSKDLEAAVREAEHKVPGVEVLFQ
jgi:hypothetical protein